VHVFARQTPRADQKRQPPGPTALRSELGPSQKVALADDPEQDPLESTTGRPLI
jgi:hypothetical protein